MPNLPSLPDNATLLDLFGQYPEFSTNLAPLHEYVMRGESELTPKDRELIAAFVSTINACDYCAGSHSEVAKNFGVPTATIAALADGADAAPIDEKLRPIFRYVEKLTLTPSRMTDADARAVYDAGWDQEALYRAVLVCCVFNFMNRLIEGTGLVASDEQASKGGKILFEKGYLGVRAVATGIE